MARFDVCALRNGEGYVLDVQADILDHLNTRVVVPLLPKKSAPQPANRLNPVVDIDGEAFVMVTQFLAAVPKSELGNTILSMDNSFAEITAALDMVFQGHCQITDVILDNIRSHECSDDHAAPQRLPLSP